MLRLGATQVKQVAHRAPNENPSRAPAMPDATPQVVYMTCRAFMRRSADLTGGRRASLRSSARTCARRRTMSSIRRPRLSSLLSPSHHLLFPRRPAASASCPRVCTSPRTRGGWSADRRTRLLCRACEARRSALAIRGPSRCNRDALSALHRGDFRPRDPRCRLRQWHRSRPATCLRPAIRPGGRGPGPPAAAVRAAAAGRHSPLRLQDRLRRRPS